MARVKMIVESPIYGDIEIEKDESSTIPENKENLEIQIQSVVLAVLRAYNIKPS